MWWVSGKTTRPSTIADQSSVEGPSQNSTEGHTEVVQRRVTSSIIAPLDRLSRRAHACVRSIVMRSIPIDAMTQKPALQPTPWASAHARPYRLISDPFTERFARDPLAVWVGVALDGLVRVATGVGPISWHAVIIADQEASMRLPASACSAAAPSSAPYFARSLANHHRRSVGDSVQLRKDMGNSEISDRERYSSLEGGGWFMLRCAATPH
jgi:hypothetical protein